METENKRKHSKWEFDEFAYHGTPEAFDKKINFLATVLADKEPWQTPNSERANDILLYYIIKQFARCNQQGLLAYSEDGEYCVSNTGLMTSRGEDVYMLFARNRYYGTVSKTGHEITQKWVHIGFFKQSDRDITNLHLDREPGLPVFWDNEKDAFFDTSAQITINIDHIIDDHWDREENIFPQELKQLGKDVVTSLFKAAFETSKRKAKRNMFLVVPQFYDGKYMFLMPLSIDKIGDGKPTVIALALEKQCDIYRGNTIFNLETAYKKARLINRPESNWLSIADK